MKMPTKEVAFGIAFEIVQDKDKVQGCEGSTDCQAKGSGYASFVTRVSRFIVASTPHIHDHGADSAREWDIWPIKNG